MHVRNKRCRKTLIAIGAVTAVFTLWWLSPWMSYSDLCASVMRAHDGPVTRLLFAEEGRVIITAGDDGRVIAWNRETQRQLFQFGDGGAPVTALAISPDGQSLAWGTNSGNVNVASLHHRKVERTIQAHRQQVSGLAFSPGGDVLATEGLAEPICFWSTATGQRTGGLDEYYGGPDGSVAFLPDGKTVITASTFDSYPTLWNVDEGARVGHLAAARDDFGYGSFAMSSDGTLLLTGTRGWSIVIWDIVKREQILEIPAHWGPVVNGVALDLQQGFAVSCVGTGSMLWPPEMKVWNTETWNCLATAPMPRRMAQYDSAGFMSVAISPAERLVATGHFDGTVRLWEIP